MCHVSRHTVRIFMTMSETVGWISKLFYEIKYTELQGENII